MPARARRATFHGGAAGQPCPSASPSSSQERFTMSSRRPLAVVTGASSGIGFELARQFAEHGYDLLVAAEDDAIEQAAADLRRDGQNQIVAVQADLATYEGVERVYAAILETGRPVDAIALNAGRGIGGDFTR